MHYTVKVLTPPSGSFITEPISLDELKDNVVGTTSGFSDLMLGMFITSARTTLENYLGRSIATQSLLVAMDGLPPFDTWLQWPLNVPPFTPRRAMFQIPRPPLQAVTSFTITAVDGSDVTLAEDTDFTVDTFSEPGWIAPVSAWPTTLSAPNAVQIEVVAGYPDGAVPAPLRQAILLMASAGVGAAVSEAASTTGTGDLRSLSLDGLGTATFGTGTTSSRTTSAGAELITPTVRSLVDPTYRLWGF